MKKEQKLIARPWFDAPEVLADYLWRTDLVTPIVKCIGGALVAGPLTLARWLALEVRTPDNSHPPRVVLTEPGRFSGVILVHRNEARVWAMTKVADDYTTCPAHRSQVLHPDPRSSIRNDDQYRQARAPLWAEDDPYTVGAADRHDRWGGV